MLNIVASYLVITALLAYLNHRFLRLPTTIGVMAAAMVFSLALAVLDSVGVAHALREYEQSLVHSINFSELLMQGMLSLLLFAGALHVDLSELSSYRWQVASLAVFGTLISTLAVGIGMSVVLPLIGLNVPFLYLLLFGALISPTDPIAVLSILKSIGAPAELELMMAGESLFNDGVGIVVFSLLLGMVLGGGTPSSAHVLRLLLQEAGGGLLFGLILGYLTFRLLRSVDDYKVEVLLTLAAVMGGYALATRLHVSGPLAMVVGGLIIGNHGRALAMSDLTRRHLDMFWQLIDEILNAILFVLIGMEVLRVKFSSSELLAAGAAVLVTLLVRLVTVGAPVGLLPRAFDLPPGSWKVLTWGGLRGGIPIALALSLPVSAERDTIVALTYGVVGFSILAQGLTIATVTRHSIENAGAS